MKWNEIKYKLLFGGLLSLIPLTFLVMAILGLFVFHGCIIVFNPTIGYLSPWICGDLGYLFILWSLFFSFILFYTYFGPKFVSPKKKE